MARCAYFNAKISVQSRHQERGVVPRCHQGRKPPPLFFALPAPAWFASVPGQHSAPGIVAKLWLGLSHTYMDIVFAGFYLTSSYVPRVETDRQHMRRASCGRALEMSSHGFRSTAPSISQDFMGVRVVVLLWPISSFAHPTPLGLPLADNVCVQYCHLLATISG